MHRGDLHKNQLLREEKLRTRKLDDLLQKVQQTSSDAHRLLGVLASGSVRNVANVLTAMVKRNVSVPVSLGVLDGAPWQMKQCGFGRK